MQLRKNLLATLLAAMLALGAIACGGGTEEPAGDVTEGAVTEEATGAETEAATEAETEAATEEAS